MKKMLLLFFLVSNFYSNLQAQDKNSKNSNKAEMIIYGSDNCHHCLETKKFLNEKKIAFAFFDIDLDKSALYEMIEKLKKANISLSNVGIPVVDKNGVLFSNVGNFEDFLKKLE